MSKLYLQHKHAHTHAYVHTYKHTNSSHGSDLKKPDMHLHAASAQLV